MTKWICNGESLSPEYKSRPHEPFLNRSQDTECLECGLLRTAVAASESISTGDDMNNNQTNNKTNNKTKSVLWLIGGAVSASLIFLLLNNLAIKNVIDNGDDIKPGNVNQEVLNEVPNDEATITPNNENDVASTAPERICDETNLVKKSGDLYGVIEVGSKGIKAEVIQELQAPNEDGLTFIARDEDIETRDVNPVLKGNQEVTVDS